MSKAIHISRRWLKGRTVCDRVASDRDVANPNEATCKNCARRWAGGYR